MADIPAPFLGPTYGNTFLKAEQQRCVNWFPKGNTLKSRLGYEVWDEIDQGGPIRGWAIHKDKIVVVSSNEVYVFGQSGGHERRGTIDTIKGEVWLASSGWDGEEVLIVDGQDGYVYNEDTVVKITATGFPPDPHHAMFDNGFFLVLKGDSAEFYKSTNPYDAVNWDGSFATAEQNPDRNVAAITNRNDLWLIGERTLEVWYYSGEAFPWNPNRSAFQAYGTAAPQSLTKFDNNIAFLAQSAEIGLIAAVTQGVAVQRISTPVIEEEWACYEVTDDCYTWGFQYPGHGHFLVYQFPRANKTWVFDSQEKMWHEWESWDADPLAIGKVPGNRFLHFHSDPESDATGTYLFPDDSNGKIYNMTRAKFQDAGSHMVRKRMGPNLISSRNYLFYNYLELVMATGIGASGDEDPKVQLNYSDDRGATWENWREASLGGVGARTKRVGFSRLGASKERIFNVEVSNNVDTTLTNSVMEVEEGGT